jgi:phosphatidylglycerol---prolipoprotein diacylglyceryl transferase
MHPVLFRVGSTSFSSYGVMLALGIFIAGWLLARELRRTGGDADLAWELLFFAATGGFVGAKVLYMLVHEPATLRDPLSALVQGGGLTWYGGLLVGLPLVVWRLRRRGIAALPVLDRIAPGVPVAYASARVGCFLVGDDYGLPSALPWAMSFAAGTPPSTAGNLRDRFGVALPADMPADALLRVHPTQLYEVALSLAIFGVLWGLRRRPAPVGRLFALWLVLAGAERIAVEFLRAKNDRVLGPFTVAQAISLALVCAGALLLASRTRQAHAPRPAPASR